MSTSPRAPRGFFPADLTPLILSGWQTNKFDGSIPFWADVDGLQFTETGVRRKPGHSFLLRPLNSVGVYKPIRGLTSIQEYGTKVIYAGDLTKLYRYKQNSPEADGEIVGSGYNLVEKAGASTWDSGSTVWDAGSSVWDDGVIEASAWSFTNFGTWVLAADNAGPIKIKKNNENFAEMSLNKATGVTITSGGASYALNNIVTFTGGLTAKVTGVNSGVVTQLQVTNFGTTYSANQALSASGGSGANLQITTQITNCPFTRVRAVDKSGPHILAINYDKATTEHPNDVAWSAEDDPDNWAPAADNAAGSLTLREASSPLKCIVPLGENKAIYTDDQMFILSYLGSPFYFGYQTAMTSGVGAVSARSVVSVDRVNYGLSRRGLFMTDGNSVTRLGDGEGINRYILANISESEYPQVCAYHNKKNNEVIWSLPLGDTKPNVEITYNYSTGVFSKKTSNVSAALESGVFPHVITASSSSSIYLEDESASAHTTSALTKAHDLDDPYSIKEITSVRVGKIGSGDPLVQMGWANNIDDEPTFNPADSFYVNSEYKEYPVRTSGRYLFMKVSSSGDSDTWEISNIVIKGRIRGFR
tara:strand:- start:2730 stop:4493 length:1764 start_codon:yes stop_codon:yes gene_type:complete